MACISIKSLIEKWENENEDCIHGIKVTSCYNYFDILNTQNNLEEILMPETFIFKEGGIWKWYFNSNKNKKLTILQKRNNKLFTDNIKDHFRKIKQVADDTN